jgi:hypothetical protein
MAKVKLGASVDQESFLWRYMSIDKLINLLDTKSLYFTALDSYRNSDPFEGFMPKVALEAFAEIFSTGRSDLENGYKKLLLQFEALNSIGITTTDMHSRLINLRAMLDAQPEYLRNLYKAVVTGIKVNCWHRSNCESEAMWKLYSDIGKGIAIKTRVSSLVGTIEDDPEDGLVQIGAVKYLDFHDLNISPRDCVVDGHTSPLLKRNSFSHENEVRLFTLPAIDSSTWQSFQPKGEFIKVSSLDFIDAIYISPFVGEPFTSSVYAICGKYNISHSKIRKSTLLSGDEDFLNSLLN